MILVRKDKVQKEGALQEERTFVVFSLACNSLWVSNQHFCQYWERSVI